MKLIIFLIPLLLSNISLAAIFKSPPTHINGFAEISASSVDDLQTESRVVSFSMFADIQQTVLKNLEARVIAGGVFQTGSNESLFVDEFRPRQDLVLKEASLNYSPVSQLSLKLGALGQGEYKSPLLLTNSAFVSAKESLNFTFGDYSFGLFLSQSVPSNHSLTNRLGTVDEGAPSLLMEGIRFYLAGDILFLKAQLMQFRYNNLSANVAQNSAFLGNSTGGSSPSTSFFLYDFEGHNVSVEVGITFSEAAALTLAGQYLYNKKAPNNRNSGYLLKAELELLQLKLTLEVFDNDSDSAPAFYNSSTYGHNDRTGLGLGLGMLFPKETTEVFFNAYKLKAKNRNLYLSDSTRFFLGLKRSFDFN